ncbi:Vesicle transport v-SNARE 12 [Vitis vinifera]|uniref:Vesicle transport v-SNARE 12 n=1 Tax=Vitis vinifera TaxID=29760 RepID=A0A438D139_VITVI|nr:Vesicle transport v-SNARE 12 [Vitis vinifera]
MLETEDLGVSILQDLHQQRQTLLHAHEKLHGVDNAIDKSKKILTAMSKRMSRNKWIVGSVISALVLAIIFILYFSFLDIKWLMTLPGLCAISLFVYVYTICIVVNHTIKHCTR